MFAVQIRQIAEAWRCGARYDRLVANDGNETQANMKPCTRISKTWAIAKPRYERRWFGLRKTE